MFIKCAICVSTMQKSLHGLPHLIIIILLWTSVVVCNCQTRIWMSVSCSSDREVVNGTEFEYQYTASESSFMS